ncbi:hypothetical protein FRACYDRAFT_234711 [Fragilariopsis cylindrus CCMP1102]|uniref:Uncharacterized protein n=1 Tax=Fragilariopsis cylindrus CCMP1102 TaxID=635003 RepID=A0A1E7FSM3_9STRA|nr:hypothetical protein FRACYDRAFT_234711 [Fragilariopsis cylindrus CCMP1102]|eukprot:OEU21085.1 hypothetical protein FRACYDRAFT_234711 [Fragilariopsis cylindrus CCMP1102]
MADRSSRRFTIPQPIAEEEQQQQQQQQESQQHGFPIIVEETNYEAHQHHHGSSSASSFINSVKNIFAPCVGAVDAASLFMDDCRPSKFDTWNTNQQAMNRQKRGKTLEIPTHSGMMFDDDDVSAISAHTLEEMELLRMAQKSKRGAGISNIHMSPPPTEIWRNSNTSTNNILGPKSSRYQHHQQYQKQHPTISTTRKSTAAVVQGQGQQHTTSPFSSFTNKQILKIQQHHQSSPVFSSNGDLSICVSASESSSSSDDMVGLQEKHQQDEETNRVG